MCEAMEDAAHVQGNQSLILILTDKDLIGTELSYHRTCFRSHSNAKQLKLSKRTEREKNSFSSTMIQPRTDVI